MDVCDGPSGRPRKVVCQAACPARVAVKAPRERAVPVIEMCMADLCVATLGMCSI